MALKTKVDLHSFRGVMRSKVFGLPLPVVAVAAGVGAVIFIRRHQAAAGASSDASSSDASGSSSGGGYSGGADGGSSGGGSTFFPPVPVPIPAPRPGRRPRIQRRGVIDKTVIYRKNGNGATVRIVRRLWAGGTTVVRRRVIGGGAPPRINRIPPRASSERVTLPRQVQGRTAQSRNRRRPRPSTVPTTHFA